jgi:hypothetical protein
VKASCEFCQFTGKEADVKNLLCSKKDYQLFYVRTLFVDQLGQVEVFDGSMAFYLQMMMPPSVECLSLTVEEVMHIRSVLTKAELECIVIEPELYYLLVNGKVSHWIGFEFKSCFFSGLQIARNCK